MLAIKTKLKRLKTTTKVLDMVLAASALEKKDSNILEEAKPFVSTPSGEGRRAIKTLVEVVAPICCCYDVDFRNLVYGGNDRIRSKHQQKARNRAGRSFLQSSKELERRYFRVWGFHIGRDDGNGKHANRVNERKSRLSFVLAITLVLTLVLNSDTSILRITHEYFFRSRGAGIWTRGKRNCWEAASAWDIDIGPSVQLFCM